jgi:hypothetical protein
MGDIYGGNDRLVMASPQDIAEAVSKEIVKTENIDRVVYVNSDERKCNEVAAVLGAAIGIPDMKWGVLTKEDVLNTLANTHIPEHTAAMLVELGEAIHSGRLREDFDSHIPLSDKVKLEDFAQEFARVFHQH